MAYSFFSRWLPVLFIGTVLLTGCSKKTNGPSSNGGPTTVLNYLAGEKSVSLFYSAFQKAKVSTDSAYLSGGPYTFFIPADTALISAGVTADSIGRMDPATLSQFVRYPIVKGRLSPASLVGYYKLQASSLDTARPIIIKNYYGIFFNGDPLAVSDIELGDGVINILGSAPVIPRFSVLQIIGSRPELSILNAVLNACSSDGAVASMLQKTGKTIFAPTNAAFALYGIPTPDSATRYDVSKLSEIIVEGFTGDGEVFGQPSHPGDYLKYTVSSAEFLGGYPIGVNAISGYTGTSTLNTYTGINTLYSLKVDGVTIQTAGNLTPPHIVNPNIWATDGILHEVDQVIIAK
jgi:uncharacterized surface protein with fasciclin (FAS1) repeats